MRFQLFSIRSLMAPQHQVSCNKKLWWHNVILTYQFAVRDSEISEWSLAEALIKVISSRLGEVFIKFLMTSSNLLFSFWLLLVLFKMLPILFEINKKKWDQTLRKVSEDRFTAYQMELSDGHLYIFWISDWLRGDLLPNGMISHITNTLDF
jgi:hypothetical protein